MNVKHAKDLRTAALHWMAQVINDTPLGMTPDIEGATQAADRMQAMVLECWPKLNAKQRGKIGQLLELQRIAGTVRLAGGGYKYKDLNAIARMVVTMAKG